MEKINEILDNLSNRVPQALARFNDGEMGGILNVNFVAARGDQVVNQSLSNALKEALEYEQCNYWKGIPCEICFPKYYDEAKKIVRVDYPYLTKAVVNTNRNWKKVIEEFPKRTKGRNVKMVVGVDQDLFNLSKVLNWEIQEWFRLPLQNAWGVCDWMKSTIWEDLIPGDIVLFSCGPLARVLVRRWFEKRPDCTFIDVGSTFDPYTRNVWHRCHKGTLPSCRGCN